MASVPYTPVPTVSPTTQGAPSLRVAVPGAAFGTEVAQAIGTFGKTLENSGNELFGRAVAMQQLNNESEAKDADAKYMIEAGKLHADYSALEGKAAVDAYPKYVENLEGLRQQYRTNLSNDMSRRMFDSASLSTMGRTIFNGAGHAATENKRYAIGTSNALIDAKIDQAYHSPMEGIQGSLVDIEREIRETQSPLAGWSKEQEDEEVRKAQSKLLSNRIIGLARTKPLEAKEMFEQNIGALHGPDVDKVQKAVDLQLNITGSRVIEQKINADLRDDPMGENKSLQDRLAEADREAAKIAPDNAAFRDYLRSRVETTYRTSRMVKRETDQENQEKVQAGLQQGVKNIDELRALPGVGPAFDALPKKEQNAIPRQIERYNAAKDQAGQQQTYWGLKGQAESDPLGFQNVDITKENLSQAQMKELWNLQRAKRKDAAADPRITHAMQILRPMVYAAGVNPRDDMDKYNQFLGALQDQLTEATTKDGKPPDAKKINEIGARLLQQQHSPEFWFSGSTDFMFQLPTPAKEAEVIKADPKWQSLGITPDDNMIHRIYVRKLYKDLYGGAPSAEVPTSK